MDTFGWGRYCQHSCVSIEKFVQNSIYTKLDFSSDQDSSKIYIYDGQGTNTSLHVLEKLHTKPVCMLRYNVTFDVVVSVDRAGILEYWTGPKQDYKFPSKLVSFESKLDTSKNRFFLFS